MGNRIVALIAITCLFCKLQISATSQREVTPQSSHVQDQVHTAFVSSHANGYETPDRFRRFRQSVRIDSVHRSRNTARNSVHSLCCATPDSRRWQRHSKFINPINWVRKSDTAVRSTTSPTELTPKKVSIVGSGNFACAIARIVGANCKRNPMLADEVRMWVFEEIVNGRKLTDIINEDHENVKYMPGVKLPPNLIADADLASATRDADVLIFCLPHQFLDGVCEKILNQHAPGCIAISLIKAVEFDADGILLISDMIRRRMGGMDVSVLMGANLANEIGSGQFCETTIGCRVPAHGRLLKDIFNDPLFQVSVVDEVAGVEVCGALKNIVALGAGFLDGMGLGDNSKAAIIRQGLLEMKRFVQSKYPGVADALFFESCGMADLIVTCYGGRNRLCAEAFVRAGGDKTFEQIEAELLGGQKLQGTLTCREVHRILARDGALDRYPLFRSVHQIAFEGAPVDTMLAALGAFEVRRVQVKRALFGEWSRS